MKIIFLAGAAILLLSGCASTTAGGPTALETTALVTCGSEVAAVNVLADLKHAGKLSTVQIAAVNTDIQIVDPICSNSSPDTLLTGVEQAAAAELISLAGAIR